MCTWNVTDEESRERQALFPQAKAETMSHSVELTLEERLLLESLRALSTTDQPNDKLLKVACNELGSFLGFNTFGELVDAMQERKYRITNMVL